MNETDLQKIRADYTKASLREKDVEGDPISFFQKWLEQAIESGISEPTAMAISTVSLQGKPSSRIVLLKGLENGVFKFYTNYSSQKGRELAVNPYASLLFFWAELERQIRIEGKVTKLSREESWEYFRTRPRESCIGAHASLQSSVIPSREFLEKKYGEMSEQFSDLAEIPLPENWGGYALEPDAFEFWQGRPNRLHDRLRFRKQKSTWILERLSP